MKLVRPAPGTMQVGTFVKTTSPQVIEILGTTALDFAVVDAEHAPFDRGALDLMMLAGRAVGLPLLVRIPDMAPATIGSVLDLGAAGLLVPHVDTAEQARQVVSRARFRGGERGFSGSPRFAGYGTLGMKEAIAAGDDTLVMAQIESTLAVQNVAGIAATPGIDGLFIGRADLALSMGESDTKSPRVAEATARIIRAALDAGKIPAMFVGGLAERDQFAAQGVTWFTVGSDQSLMRQGAQSIASPTSTRARK